MGGWEWGGEGEGGFGVGECFGGFGDDGGGIGDGDLGLFFWWGGGGMERFHLVLNGGLGKMEYLIYIECRIFLPQNVI